MSDTIGEVGTAVETIPETKPIVPPPEPPKFKRTCEPVGVEMVDGKVEISQGERHSYSTKIITISVDQLPMLIRWLQEAQNHPYLP